MIVLSLTLIALGIGLFLKGLELLDSPYERRRDRKGRYTSYTTKVLSNDFTGDHKTIVVKQYGESIGII